MFKKINFVVILLFAINCETKKSKLPPSHPYLYNLELKFREDKISDYIVDSFFASSGEDGEKLIHCNVTLLDLFKALPTKKITVADFTKALADVGLLQDNEDLSGLVTDLNYADLNAAGFSAGKLYKNIAKTYFKDRSEDLLQCLNILGIAEEFSVAYTFGTDEDIFNAFQNANYSYHNLAEIANLIGGSSTLKELFSAFGLKKLDFTPNVVDKYVAQILKGLTRENLKNLLETLGLTVSNYKDSKAFKACYSSLTKEKSLAVAVSQDDIITNDDEILIKYLNLELYTTLVAKSFQAGVAYNIAADDIKRNDADNIIHLKINGILSNFIDQSDGNEDLSSGLCQYATVYYDDLVIQNVRPNFIADQLTVPKLYNTPFKKGSPLICDGKLTGLASIDKFGSIVFDYVQNHQEDVVPPPIEYKPEVIDAIVKYFESKYPNFNPCKFLHCGVNEENDEGSANDENMKTDGTKDEAISNTPAENEDTSEEVIGVTESALSSEENNDLQTSSGDHTEAEQEQGTENASEFNTESSSGTNAVDIEITTPDQSDTAESVKEGHGEGSEESVSEVTSQESSNVTPDLSKDSNEEPDASTEVLEDISSGVSEVEKSNPTENSQFPASAEEVTSEEANDLVGIVP